MDSIYTPRDFYHLVLLNILSSGTTSLNDGQSQISLIRFSSRRRFIASSHTFLTATCVVKALQRATS